MQEEVAGGEKLRRENHNQNISYKKSIFTKMKIEKKRWS